MCSFSLVISSISSIPNTEVTAYDHNVLILEQVCESDSENYSRNANKTSSSGTVTL